MANKTLRNSNADEILYRVYLRDGEFVSHVIFPYIGQHDLQMWLYRNAYPVLDSGLTVWFYMFDDASVITFVRIQ